MIIYVYQCLYVTSSGVGVQVVELMRREVKQPYEFTALILRRFDELVTSKADSDIDELVERNPSFDEYGQELRRYSAVLDDINYNSVKVIRIGMFEVDTTYDDDDRRNNDDTEDRRIRSAIAAEAKQKKDKK